MTHSFITIVIPFSPHCLGAVETKIEVMGNPIAKQWRDAVDQIGEIHFFSINVVPPGRPGDQPHLLVELTTDGTAEMVLEKWCSALAQPLEELAKAAGLVPGENGSASAVWRDRRFRINPGIRWRDRTGLNFSGSPAMSVRRIVDEAELAEFAQTKIFDKYAGATALDTLAGIRNDIVGLSQTDPDGAGKRFARMLRPEDAPFLRGPEGNLKTLLPSLVLKLFTGYLLPVTFVTLVLSTAVFVIQATRKLRVSGSLWEAVARSLLPTALTAVMTLSIFATLILVAFFVLRRREARELTTAVLPDQATVAAIMCRENASLPDPLLAADENASGGTIPLAKDRSRGTPPESFVPVLQNHMFAVSIMKAGILRQLTIRFAYWVVASLLGRFYRPGFLGEIGTIHFARWVLLPGNRQLVFLSNYGGSWESYLEDFITRASQGLTAIWSNTIGFPQSRALFLDGATDGDRFKLWARRQQLPSLCWYTAYPNLTTARIRSNAAIRQGLLAAKTPSEAADWMSCFNSAPKTAATLEAEDIQSLAYGAMGHLEFARALVLNFQDDGMRARAWLAALEPAVTTAQQFPEIEARIVAFSYPGIEKLLHSERTISSLPAAFQHGMDAEWRARILGDVGEDSPDNWAWGGQSDPQSQAHAVLLLYAKSAKQLTSLLKAETGRAASHGVKILQAIELKIKRSPEGGRALEPFGFADGISQPIILGTPRAKKLAAETDHLVEPGEFILGYADNRGFLPPSPVVGANRDPNNLLKTAKPDQHAQRPDYTNSEAGMERDFGRNGSYLVVRQLQQDVPAFDEYLGQQAMQLQSSSMMKWVDADLSRVTLEDWIGAKMVGRWKDGSSIARHPSRPRTADGERGLPDNRFRFGEDDPSGYACPLSAHVRRANPRDSFSPGSALQRQITNRHRILRVGRSYADGSKKNSGLLFMCLNADIERQFEFIQQTWCMATQFHGVDNETDPILGRGTKATQMTIPTPAGPIKIAGLRKFIKMVGGGYFFMPSRSALKWLSAE